MFTSKPVIFVWAVSVLQLAAFAADPTQAPSASLIAQHADQTETKLKSTAAKWTTTISMGNGGGGVVADWMNSPAGSRVEISFQGGGHVDPIATIIDRDGFWYVTEGRHFGKYRRFEMPFVLPNTPLLYITSLPRSGANLVENAGFESMAGSIATYRLALPEWSRSQMQSILDQAEEMRKTHPEALNTPEFQKMLPQMRDVLAHGFVARVDVDSGYLTELASPKLPATWTQLQWLEKPDLSAIDVTTHDWVDHSAGPTAVDPNNLVMMAHEGTWTPGSRAGDSDSRVVNIKTGETWRVPYQSGTSMVGCFLKDRSSVVVSGIDVLSGGIGLVSIDLRTGKNHPLGGKALPTGICTMPVVSHDGRTIAVLHKGPSQKILEEQVYLIDLASIESHPIGKPMDTAYLSWLPDDSGLVLLKRDPDLTGNTDTTSIAKMTLQGEVTTIRPGDSPLVLKNGRILFEDRSVEPKVWKTSQIDGSGETLLGDGLTQYGFASESPDGKHLLMMHFSGNRKFPPVPTILDIDGTNPQPIPVAAGLWSQPTW